MGDGIECLGGGGYAEKVTHSIGLSLGIGSIERGEPKILFDQLAAFAAIVDSDGVMTGHDPTIEDVIAAHQASGIDFMTPTELYEQTVSITNGLVRQGERDMRFTSTIIGRTIGRGMENNLGRASKNMAAQRVRNR